MGNVSIWTITFGPKVTKSLLPGSICHHFRLWPSKARPFRLFFVLGSRFGGATLQKVRKRKATDTVWPFLRFCHFWSKSDGQNDYVLHYFSTWCPMVTFASQKYNFSLGKINVLRKWNFHFCTCRFGVGICKLNSMFFGSRNDEMATSRKVV